MKKAREEVCVSTFVSSSDVWYCTQPVTTLGTCGRAGHFLLSTLPTLVSRHMATSNTPTLVAGLLHSWPVVSISLSSAYPASNRETDGLARARARLADRPPPLACLSLPALAPPPLRAIRSRYGAVQYGTVSPVSPNPNRAPSRSAISYKLAHTRAHTP